MIYFAHGGEVHADESSPAKWLLLAGLLTAVILTGLVLLYLKRRKSPANKD